MILLFVALFAWAAAAAELPPNQWTELARDPDGARRGSAIRYVPDTGQFFQWGFMNSDPDLLQENPLAPMPEYDAVYFDPAERRWRNHLPANREREWTKRLPLAYLPRTYSGITTGSERTVMRGVSDDSGSVPRPDLNIVFDQVTWHPSLHGLVYFTGGLTAAYEVSRHRWRDLAPRHSPPPVLGGSLAYDPVSGGVILFGGGHVAERGPGGRIAGYTGTWIWRDGDWTQLETAAQPPPRMNTRMVCDPKASVLVLFGGDGQSRYLADTWIFDLKTRSWRASKPTGGPQARAGHFTVYDPATGWVIIGGGYNRTDLRDMWAYDTARDNWRRLKGEVPTGFYLSADIAPEKRLIVLVTATRRPGDRTSCNVLFPVRTTYGYRIEKEGILEPEEPRLQASISKRPEPRDSSAAPLGQLAPDRWVRLSDGGEPAPARTWGSATFDSDREQILYWGGGHCGYEGSDVEAYDVASQRWVRREPEPEFPERLWNHGVRLAGVTFQGRPWTDHGRRIYAYDPVSRRMIVVRAIRLTSGYEPEALRAFPSHVVVAPDALVRAPSSYVKSATWTYDPVSGEWQLAGPAPAGVDTLVTTPLGVMGVTVNWPARLNDSGYQLPWRPSQPPMDNAIFLYRARENRWERLSEGPSPQNLYEMTSLAFDSRRNQVILHGAGAKRDELWIFDLQSRRWSRRDAPDAPPCTREAVYIPGQDVFLVFDGSVSVYKPESNRWERRHIAFDGPTPKVGQNRAMVYDARRDLVLLVLGESGDNGKASVYGLRTSAGGNR